MGKNLRYLTVLLIANIISFAVFAQPHDPPKRGGNIKNSVTGAPVSKASVKIKGDKGLYPRFGLYPEFSDAKGVFRIYAADKALPFTLVISAQGYKTKEVVVDSYDSINVKLKPTNNDGSVKSKPKSGKKQ
jgi:hypothetical protein